MPIIDCHTLVGPYPDSEVDLTLEALAAGMQARGIRRSLVTHTSAVYYDSTLGNDAAIRLCSQHQPLEAVAVLNPLQYPRCVEEVERCLSLGIRVFRFCPREHEYPFAGGVGPLREVMARLSGAKLLMVDLAGVPAPVLGADLLDILPAPLAVCVTPQGLGTVLHAAGESDRILVETTRLLAGGSIEAAVRAAGAERVVFGSRSPLLAVGCAVMTVQYAQLSEADRAAVFEGNLQRILG